jgi:hypothetical protein
MYNAKRTVLIVMVFCVGLTGLCSADSKEPTVDELLDKYVATQKKIYGSFIAEYEIIKDDYKNYDWAIEKGRRKRGEDTIVRWDGERFYWSQKNWGNTCPPVDEYVPRDDPRHSRHLWDGKKFYQFGRSPDYMLKESAERKFKTQAESRARSGSV